MKIPEFIFQIKTKC